MKHVYPRTIALAAGAHPRVDLDRIVTHEFPLAQTGEAFRIAATYADDAIKVVVRPNGD
jgi:threonine dehydrogenase-like Zn-dependent dehydrogenase